MPMENGTSTDGKVIKKLKIEKMPQRPNEQSTNNNTATIDDDENNNNNCAGKLNQVIENMGTQSYDEAVLRYQDEIAEEIAEKNAKVGELESLVSLRDEFVDNPLMAKKLPYLQSKYSMFRRTRGDGNCFYRALAFRLFELCMEKKLGNNFSLVDGDKLRKIFKDAQSKLVARGFSLFTVEDFCDTVVEGIDRLEASCVNGDEDMARTTLLSLFQEDGFSDYIVVYLRLLTTLSILENEEFYLPFIEALGHADVTSFCKHEVEPMGRDCDHPQIIAVVTLLGITIKIEYFDQSESDETTAHVFPSDGGATSVILLYRPGHYDLLYE